MLLLLILWNIFRFVTEAIYDTVGPREFMAVSIGYVARWMWLAAEPLRSRRCRRWIRVVRGLRKLSMVRVGSSTRTEREGDFEVVYRTAMRRVGRDFRKEEREYWRGYEVSVRNNVEENEEHGAMDEEKRWLVHIHDETLYLEKLEPVLNGGHWNASGAKAILYDSVYSVILTSFPAYLDMEEDWSKEFDEHWGLLKPTYMAREAGATAEGPRADIARKVAADAVQYAFAKKGRVKLRLTAQIRMICRILERVANECWKASKAFETARGP